MKLYLVVFNLLLICTLIRADDQAEPELTEGEGEMLIMPLENEFGKNNGNVSERRLLCHKLRKLRHKNDLAAGLYKKICKCKQPVTTTPLESSSTTTPWETTTTTEVVTSPTIDEIGEGCYWCDQYCDRDWEYRIDFLRNHPEYCPQCIDQCSNYGYSIGSNYLKALYSTTVPYTTPSSTIDVIGDMCDYCAHICQWNWEENFNYLNHLSPDHCPNCISECAQYGYNIENNYRPIPAPETTIDVIGEECENCAHICQWNWKAYLTYLNQLGPNHCPNCISKCSQYGYNIQNNYRPETTIDVIVEECYWCAHICESNWEAYLSFLNQLGPDYCPNCTSKCAPYGYNIQNNYRPTTVPETTISYTTSSTTVDGIAEECYWCGEICEWNWERYLDVRNQQGPDFCPKCINKCAQYGYIIQDNFVPTTITETTTSDTMTTPITETTPSSTVDVIGEECYWCGEICEWNWETYLSYRNQLGPAFCPNCINKCAQYGYTIQDNFVPTTITETTTSETTPWTTVDIIGEECYWCGEICERNWETYLGYRDQLGADFCPNCIGKCAQYGYTILDNFRPTTIPDPTIRETTIPSTSVPYTTPSSTIDVIGEECYWCGEICEWSWETYFGYRDQLGADFCPNCISKCAQYGYTIQDNYRPTTVPETTIPYTTPSTTVDIIGEECYWCGEICERNWETYLGYRDQLGPDFCPNCISKCAQYGYTIQDNFRPTATPDPTITDTTPSTTVPYTTPSSTIDEIGEECYWCGEICEWSWETYLDARRSMGPNYCPNCISKCAQHGYNIKDNFVPTTFIETTTTTPETTITSTTVPITTPSSTIDTISEECYWCGEICQWSWEQYLDARRSMGPNYCENCISKCARIGWIIKDNYRSETTIPQTTT